MCIRDEPDVLWTAGEMATVVHGSLVCVSDAGELLRNGQGVMPHFIQAEAKINASKNTEVPCWKSKWQIVWMLLNFLAPSHSCTLQCGACRSCRRTLWYNGELNVVSYRSIQLLIAGSSPCMHFWSTELYMVLKNVCSFYNPPYSFGFSLKQLCGQGENVLWIHHKHSACPVIAGIGE